MRRMITPPQPGLFSRDYNICIMALDGNGRGHQYTYGLDYVVNECSGNVTRVINKKDNISSVVEPYTLVSLISPMDIYRLIDYLYRRPDNTKVIVGGQGAYPYKSYANVVHSIFFGRAEGIVDKIIKKSVKPYQWCYDDKNHTKYVIRRARMLLNGEVSVGCAGSCTFCQYSATRPMLGGDYNAGKNGYNVIEDRWSNIKIKTGMQTTALDGLSEYTRKRIKKYVSNKLIKTKLEEIISSVNGIARLKVFMIVGYPWETIDSVKNDIAELSTILNDVKQTGNGRIMMMITVTPFSPEPLTEMETCRANVDVNWRDIFLDDKYKCLVDKPHINAFFLPQIPSPLLLYKRVAANRITDIDVLRKISKAKTIDDCIRYGGDIYKSGRGYIYSNDLIVEGK